MNRTMLQVLSKMRLDEARALLKAKRYSGAYYLAGYAVECGLKASIAKQVKRHDFPPNRRRTEEIYKHSPSDLIKAADLSTQLQLAIEADPLFESSWSVVKEWSEQSRYEIRSSDGARDMIEAVANLKHGVMPWIKRYW